MGSCLALSSLFHPLSECHLVEWSGGGDGGGVGVGKSLTSEYYTWKSEGRVECNVFFLSLFFFLFLSFVRFLRAWQVNMIRSSKEKDGKC